MLAPAFDFNEWLRVGLFDVGAYETDGLATNPGGVSARVDVVRSHAARYESRPR